MQVYLKTEDKPELVGNLDGFLYSESLGPSVMVDAINLCVLRINRLISISPNMLQDPERSMFFALVDMSQGRMKDAAIQAEWLFPLAYRRILRDNPRSEIESYRDSKKPHAFILEITAFGLVAETEEHLAELFDLENFIPMSSDDTESTDKEILQAYDRQKKKASKFKISGITPNKFVWDRNPNESLYQPSAHAFLQNPITRTRLSGS